MKIDAQIRRKQIIVVIFGQVLPNFCCLKQMQEKQLSPKQ